MKKHLLHTADKSRPDFRCGEGFPVVLPGGGKGPAECNPYSIHHCCSNLSWCGWTHNHCKCRNCIDYRLLLSLLLLLLFVVISAAADPAIVGVAVGVADVVVALSVAVVVVVVAVAVIAVAALKLLT